MRESTPLRLLLVFILAVQVVELILPELHWNLVLRGGFRATELVALLDDPLRIFEVIPTLATHALLHGGWAHAGFNCLALLYLGLPVANRMGGARFVAFFFLTAAGGALVHGMLFPQWGVLIGASGAVFGVAAARSELLARRQRLIGVARLRYLASQATGWMIANGLMVALGVLLSMEGWMHSLIAWKAHLGGYLVGALVAGRFLGRESGWEPGFR